MEDAGAMIAFGGIFLGIYFIVKAVAQFQSMRRGNPVQEAAGRQDETPAEASDDEHGAKKITDHVV